MRVAPMNLVVNEQPVNRMQFSAPALRAGVTVVYTQADGTPVHLGRRLTFSEAISGLYRMMYEVDVARHQTDFATRGNELPTRDDRFSFVATVTIGWQVTKPEVVVREKVGDGAAVVTRRALALLREISRRHQITECEQVEREINELHRRIPIAIPEYGLSIDHISAFVTLDDAARGYLQRQVGIERQKDLDSREQDLEAQRMRGVMSAVQGELGLIALHLRHHPEESLQVLQMMHVRQQELEQRRQERFTSSEAIFTKMLDAGLVQAADVEDIRRQVLQNALSVVDGTAVPTPQPLPTQTAALPPAPSPAPDPATPPAPATRPAPARRPSGGDQAGGQPLGDPNGVGGWRPRRAPQSGTGAN